MPPVLGTTQVYPEEPCLELVEVERASLVPGGGLRRFQIVRVVRNDRVWEYMRDLGPAASIPVPSFIMKGHVELTSGRVEVLETVERLQDWAEDIRVNGIETPEPERTDFPRAYEEIATRRTDAKIGRKRFAT
jgi:hypothetical protein